MAGRTVSPGTFRRGAGALVTVGLLLCAQFAGALSYYAPGPQGSIGLSRPTIAQQFVLEPEESIVGVRMWLDEQRVLPKWGEEARVYYTPPEPLAPGLHTVRMSVEVSPGRPGFYYAPVVSEYSFTVEQGALAALPFPGPESLRALAHTNQYRAAAALPLFTYSDTLAAAAAGHARYLAVNKEQRVTDAHRQVPGTLLYFGDRAGDRLAYFADEQSLSEVINFVDRAEDAIDGFMETLYHRIPLIDPSMTMMGYGLGGSGGDLVNVLLTGADRETEERVRWPYHSQRDVPTSWSGAEIPDPFVLYPDAAKPVGYPITLTFGGLVESLALTSASLTSARGSVSLMYFDPGNDPELTDTVAVIPSQPLLPGTTYSVRLEGSIDRGNGPVTYIEHWLFTTALWHPPLLRTRTTTVGAVDSTLRRITVEGSGFGTGIQVFLGGLPVAGLSVESEGRMSFGAPIGYIGGPADLLVVAASGVESQWERFYDGTEGYRFTGTASPFTELPLTVHGRSAGFPALRHQSGLVLLPALILYRLGGQADSITNIARTYWSLGGQIGDYTLGRTAARVGDEAFTLGLPAQTLLGTLYVDLAFVRRMIGSSILTDGQAIQVGLMDIGQHWAYPQILRLLQAGIVSGTGDRRFRPDESLTRSAFVKMLVGARGLGVQPGGDGGFVDTATHWVTQQGYLGMAVEAGIVRIDDYPGAQFEPDLAISREEMAVMVVRAMDLEAEAFKVVVSPVNGLVSIAGREFTDAGEWTRAGQIAVAVENQIITGYLEADGSYTFRPARNATRAEASVIITRALDYTPR